MSPGQTPTARLGQRGLLASGSPALHGNMSQGWLGIEGGQASNSEEEFYQARTKIQTQVKEGQPHTL